MGLAFSWGLHASPLFFVVEGDGVGLALGPVLGWDNETFYFGDWDDAHGYWIGARWIGPRAHGRAALNERWRLDYDGQLALLGLLSRPPAYRHTKQETSEHVPDFLAWPTEDPKVATIADFQLVRASVDFHRTRERGRVPTGFGIGAELSFTRAVDPKPAFSFESTLRLSYTWGLQ